VHNATNHNQPAVNTTAHGNIVCGDLQNQGARPPVCVHQRYLRGWHRNIDNLPPSHNRVGNSGAGTMTFYEWLNTKLQNLELTRTAFAQIAGVGYQTLHPWRLTQFDPNMLTFLRICNAIATLTNQPLQAVITEAIPYTIAHNKVVS